MEHSKSELDLGYQGPEARRSQWEDWEGWNPPSHHSCHYPEDWARCGVKYVRLSFADRCHLRPEYGRPAGGSLDLPDVRQTRQLENIAKGTTDPRVEFISQDHISQILSILQFQNLD